eukprot:gi/632943311/ref/XP_007886881.1/ PREDICTED: centromere protein X isoform X1 [Callorhinchus milii]
MTSEADGAGRRHNRLKTAGQRNELINKLLHFYFKDPKTKINSDAVLIMSEMLKIFVVEAAVRACKQATTEDLECVDIEHFEKILPQLLLDF